MNKYWEQNTEVLNGGKTQYAHFDFDFSLTHNFIYSLTRFYYASLKRKKNKPLPLIANYKHKTIK